MCVFVCSWILLSEMCSNGDERNLLSFFFISMTRFTSAKCTKGIIKRMGVKQNNNINKRSRRVCLWFSGSENEWMNEEKAMKMNEKKERASEKEKTEKGGLWQERKNKLSPLYIFHQAPPSPPLFHAAMQNFDSIFVYSFVAKLCCSIFLSRDISFCLCVCVYVCICPAGYTNFITFYVNWWFCYCCCFAIIFCCYRWLFFTGCAHK